MLSKVVGPNYLCSGGWGRKRRAPQPLLENNLRESHRVGAHIAPDSVARAAEHVVMLVDRRGSCHGASVEGCLDLRPLRYRGAGGAVSASATRTSSQSPVRAEKATFAATVDMSLSPPPPGTGTGVLGLKGEGFMKGLRGEHA